MFIPFTDTILHDFIMNEAGRWIFIALMFVLGSAIGSFINVVVYRLPRSLSLTRPASHCPACGRRIRWYDNVPIVGWLKRGGRCRECRDRISPRYPLVELLVAATSALVTWSAIEPDGARAANEVEPAYAVDLLTLAFHLLLLDTL